MQEIWFIFSSIVLFFFNIFLCNSKGVKFMSEVVPKLKKKHWKCICMKVRVSVGHLQSFPGDSTWGRKSHQQRWLFNNEGGNSLTLCRFTMTWTTSFAFIVLNKSCRNEKLYKPVLTGNSCHGLWRRIRMQKVLMYCTCNVRPWALCSDELNRRLATCFRGGDQGLSEGFRWTAKTPGCRLDL